MPLSDYIELDHKDVPGDFKEFYETGYQMWTDPKEAPPSLRKQPLAFISVQDNHNNDMGTFVPELYELARVGGTIAQQKRDAWVKNNPKSANQEEEARRLAEFQKQDFYKVLYHVNHENPLKNHKEKTPFELAVLDVIYNENGALKKTADAARKIEKRLTHEYLYRIRNNQSLPPHVPKYQIKSDYLKNLHKIGLKAVGPRDIDLNLPNPGDKAKWYDKTIHYIVQRIAFILTMLAATTAALVASSILGSLVVAMGVILAEWCAKEFGVFGTAESFLRHLSHFSEEFRWGNKISLKKTIKTAMLFAALGAATYGVVTVAWIGIMSLPITATSTGLSASLLGALQNTLAGTVSGMAGLSTFLGGLDAVLFFWGFGIWHKQIVFTENDHLPIPNEEKRLHEKMIKLQLKMDKTQKELRGLKEIKPKEGDSTKRTTIFSFPLKQVSISEEDIKNAKVYNPFKIRRCK